MSTKCHFAHILASERVGRSEPSTHWVRSYRKRANQNFLNPEPHDMMYDRLQHHLDKKALIANREVKKSDGWGKREGTDKMNHVLDHLTRFIKRTPEHDDFTLPEYPLFFQE